MRSRTATARRRGPDPLLHAIFDCVPVVDDRPIWEWASEHITVGEEMSHPGAFDISLHPYAKEPLEVLRNRTGIEVTIQASVQSVKSLIAQVALAWMIKHRPGPAQWNAQTDDKAKDFAEFRLMPMLERCEPLRCYFPVNRHKKRTTTILFNHMFLIVQGAATPSNLQSLSVAIQVNDEVWLYPQGHLEQLRKRTTSFRSSRIILNLSTGAEEGDEADLAWCDSDQRELEVRCPCCRGWFDFRWDKDPNRPGGMVWDDNERTRNPDGSWRWRELRKTVAYECQHCGERMPYSKELQKDLLREWRFEPRNPDAPEDRPGFRWNAMAHMDWRDLVEEWHKAVAAYRRGDSSLIKEFRMKRLAQTYEDRGEDYRVEIRKTGYRMNAEGGPPPWEKEAAINRKGWPEMPQEPLAEDATEEQRKEWEKVKPLGPCRAAFIDVQQVCFYVIVRSFAMDGSSRAIWMERAHTLEDCDLIVGRFGILPSLVFIDAGDQRGYDVFRWCAERGWTALIGDGRSTWAHKQRNKGRKRVHVDPIFRPWSPVRKVSMGRGRVARQFYWSNLAMKDALDRLRRNQDPSQGATWEIPDDAPEEYFEHMESERREKHAGQWRWVQIGKRPNHYWDCEAMAVAAGHMLRLLGREAVEGGGGSGDGSG